MFQRPVQICCTNFLFHVLTVAECFYSHLHIFKCVPCSIRIYNIASVMMQIILVQNYLVIISLLYKICKVRYNFYPYWSQKRKLSEKSERTSDLDQLKQRPFQVISYGHLHNMRWPTISPISGDWPSPQYAVTDHLPNMRWLTPNCKPETSSA